MNILLLAVAPVFLIIIYIYIQDKHEKEPKKLLLYNFLLGATVSVGITTVLYLITDLITPVPEKKNIGQQFIKAYFIVALVEEFSKYVIVRYYAQPKEAFNEKFDGIVYAVMVSMGFAATENIFYVLDGGIQTAVVRAITAVPAHATFGILMGYYMGIAKFSNKRAYYNILGLILAILFHGTYDFFLFIDFIPGVWVGAFVALTIGIFLSRKAIKSHSKNSRFNI